MSLPQYSNTYPDVFGLVPSLKFNSQFAELLSLGSEKYTRTMMYFDDAKAKWGVICNNPKRKNITSINFLQSRSEGLKDEDGNFMGGLDLFFTPNQFFQWKTAKQLSQLHANYLDIDTPKHKSISSGESKLILRNVLSQLKSNNIPAPNAIVSSGSGGWHLYWIYSPIEGYVVNQIKWREITAKLLSSIKSNNIFTVDSSASSDPTRLLRLPGSFHVKAENNCNCVHLSESYDFHLLSSALELDFDVPTIKKPETIHVRAGNPHNIKDYWSKIYFKLLEVANKGKVSKDHANRDIFLFLSMVALQHIKGSSEKAFADVMKLNQRYGLFTGRTSDSNPAQVKRYLSSCFNVRYKYEKTKLITLFKDHFDCDITDLFTWKKNPLSKEEVSRRQFKSAKATHQVRKNKSQALILKALNILKAEGESPSMAKVSQLAGIAKRTVVNHKKFYRESVGAIWSVSI